ncbi:hypothetical protein BSKO_09738 [Bryopsis sp. KO-2023]|nr:hypothetical protein BSKO_09738 [Bryopsis sp. KO-2023]
MQGGWSFTELPDIILLETLKRCDGQSIARVQAVSRRFCFFGRLTTVWRESILNYHGFLVPHDRADSWRALRDVYRELVCGESMEYRLPFRGLCTDGGMQDDDASLWVDNMFHRNVSAYYGSSSISSKGVRCIGLYRPRLGATAPRSIDCCPIQSQHLITKYRKSTPRSQSLHVDRRLAGWESDSRNRVLVLTNRIQVNRAGFFINPVERGFVMLGEEKATCQSTRRSMKGDGVQLLYARATAPLTGVINGFANLESVLVAAQDGKIDVPVRVGCEIGNGGCGEWAEFGVSGDYSAVLRPVVWFRFYSRAEKLGGWTRERQMRMTCLEGKFAAMGSAFVAVNADVENSARPSGVLDIQLSRPVVGDAACVILSNGESVMSDIGNMSGFQKNVEVNYVWMMGREIEVH